MNPANTEADLYQFLARNQITTMRFEHPPVYTCEQASLELPHAPGAKIKNLLLSSPESGRLLFTGSRPGEKDPLQETGKIPGGKKPAVCQPGQACWNSWVLNREPLPCWVLSTTPKKR